MSKPSILLWYLMPLVLLLFIGCVERKTVLNIEQLMDTFGQDFVKYKNCLVRHNPVSNFGVGTIWNKEKKDSKALDAESGWLIGSPDTWYADVVSDEEKPPLLEKVIATGVIGDTSNTEKEATEIAAAVDAPDFYKILTLGGNINENEKIVKGITASNALRREMDWTQFKKQIRKGKIEEDIVKLVNTGKFFIVNRDIVLEGYKATIFVEKNDKYGLQDKLFEAVGTIIGESPRLEFEVRKATDGNFVIQAKDPVVAIVCFKGPPISRGEGTSIKSLEDLPELEAWRPVNPKYLPDGLRNLF